MLQVASCFDMLPVAVRHFVSICSRPRFGGYEALLKDLRVSDCKSHQNFCRMSNDDYEQILTLVSPLNRSTCGQNGDMSNSNIGYVEATFDLLLRHVAGVNGALQLTLVNIQRSIGVARSFSGVRFYLNKLTTFSARRSQYIQATTVN